jgi:hypothetical protein
VNKEKTMRKMAIAATVCSAALLASAPVSAAISAANPNVAAMKLQQQPITAASLVNRPVYQPAAANLAKTCSDPWWQMSGIQALTCLYMAAR